MAMKHAPPQSVPAWQADAFVEIVGVCTHWGYSDTPYGFAYDGVKRRLLESGIRHVRDGILRPVEVQRVEELGRAGVRFCIVAEPEVGTPEQIGEKVRAINARVPGAIVAVEGPNEPDLFWEQNKKAYGGKSGANGSREAVEAATRFLRDVYKVLKADPATRDITVIGIALGRTYDPGGGSPNPLTPGSLADTVDWGNFHPYFGGNPFSVPFRYGTIEKYLWDGTHPSTNIDEFPYALNVFAPPYSPKPMAATEAGCATDTNGTSETAHGKYIPRMFLEYFRKGIRRTYSYEFVDEFTDPNNREARFGLLRRDLTPKPAYTALKNLLGVLADKGPAFRAGALDYALNVSPVGEWNRLQYVRSLPFRKRNGDFYLVWYHEVANEDKSARPRRQITPPPLPAELVVGTPILPGGTLYQWDERGEMTTQPLRLDNGKVRLEVLDRVSVLRLRPLKGT